MVFKRTLPAHFTTSSSVTFSTASIYASRLKASPLRAAVENVTLDDVVKCAGSVKLHTTYFLKGGSK